MTFEHTRYPGSGDTAAEALVSLIDRHEPGVFMPALQRLYDHYELLRPVQDFARIAIGEPVSPYFDSNYRPYTEGALFGLLSGLGTPSDTEKDQLVERYANQMRYLRQETDLAKHPEKAAEEHQAERQLLVHEWGDVGLVISDDDTIDAVELLASMLVKGERKQWFFANGFGLSRYMLRKLDLDSTSDKVVRRRILAAGNMAMRHFAGPIK